MNLETVAKVEKYQSDLANFSEDCLVVQDITTAEIVPLKFNKGQRVLHAVAEKQKKERGWVRILLLKTRRFGGSTYIEARFYWRTSLNWNRHTFIISHESESTDTLYQMATLFHERNPIRPATLASNAKELVFDTKNGKGLKSQYRLATAKNLSAGRSQGYHYLHDCLSLGSKIILADGSTKKVGQIKVGDLVVTSSGAIAPVKNVFLTGEKELFEVATWLNNEPIQVSAEHKFSTISGERKCSELTESDWVQIPQIPISEELNKINFKSPYKGRVQGGGTSRQESAEVDLDIDAGYYFGYYLAEGSIHKNHLGLNDRVHFAYHESENFIENVYRFAKKYCTSRGDSEDSTKRKRTAFYGRFLADLTEAICGRVEDKHIPSWFFQTNSLFLRALVQGYIDGDGSKTYPERIIVSSIREKISRQIRRIIISLGLGVPGFAVSSNRDRYGVPNATAFIVRLDGDTHKWFMGHYSDPPHKATKYVKIEGKVFVKIKSISKVGIGETRDIEIDHPDHNFETTIGVVSNSEEAYWVNAEILLPSLLIGLPKPPAESECFRESTANGYGNRFQRDCFAAYDSGKTPYYTDSETDQVLAWKNPGQDWVIVLIPWFVDEHCSKEFETQELKERFEESISAKRYNKDTNSWEDSEELLLKKRFSLTLEQLNWRAWTIENVCRGSVDVFHQEHPTTIEEAFLSTGSNVYPADLCDLIEAQCRPPTIIGDVVERLGKVVIRPNKHGSFKIWNKPEQGLDYFITVDSAGGLKPGDIEKKEPDPSCIDVWERLTGAQVAQWHGHINYDMIADLVFLIGKYYAEVDEHGDSVNLPVACVELMNHGYTVVAGLVARKYPQYEHKQDEPGWMTSSKTKPQMVDGLYEATRDGILQVRCSETVSEMRTFVDKGGSYNAETGCHDDRVTTACLASRMMRLLPRRPKRDGVERKSAASSGGFVNWKKRGSGKEFDSGYEEIYAP